jgi:hypothetical protein
MAANWYFARHKQKLGPFSWNQLRQLAAFGLLQRSDHVLQEGTPKWREAGAVADLFPRQTSLKEYRLSISGKPYGPYTSDQVRIFLLAGRLPATTLAHTGGMAQWLPLGEIPDFAGYAPRPADSKAVLVVDRTEAMSKAEAELHLAGKSGDNIARLVSQLLDLKRRFTGNTTMLHSLDQNIQHLLALREQRSPWGGGQGGRG